ncbi:hypothetical protein HNQ65_003339 [Prosthecobacter vanneervenii]|uniref:Uncharacterized protein n=1 Tax=Prosthecobacter vanneervenii TaxID=48466 RepID=A0A7W7YCR7_9BACT|nr:hypothetical protein [Prosthecobacter vanneervenii]
MTRRVNDLLNSSLIYTKFLSISATQMRFLSIRSQDLKPSPA